MSHISVETFNEFSKIYGFKCSKDDSAIRACLDIDENTSVICRYKDGSTILTAYSCKKLVAVKSATSIRQLLRKTDKILSSLDADKFVDIGITNSTSITAAINTRDLANKLVRVKSSNVWAYGMNIRKHGNKVGDIITQFKNADGGPGDVYILYDVPVRVYQRWQSAPSKGHFYWQYLRNNYKYSKLTGDKRGKLPNAVN